MSGETVDTDISKISAEKHTSSNLVSTTIFIRLLVRVAKVPVCKTGYTGSNPVGASFFIPMSKNELIEKYKKEIISTQIENRISLVSTIYDILVKEGATIYKSTLIDNEDLLISLRTEKGYTEVETTIEENILSVWFVDKDEEYEIALNQIEKGILWITQK